MKIVIGLICLILLNVCLAKDKDHKDNKHKEGKQPYYSPHDSQYSTGYITPTYTRALTTPHAHPVGYTSPHIRSTSYNVPTYRTNPLSYDSPYAFNNQYGNKVIVDTSPTCSIRRTPFYSTCHRLNSCNTCASSPTCGWCGNTNSCVPGVSRYASCQRYCAKNWHFDSDSCSNLDYRAPDAVTVNSSGLNGSQLAVHTTRHHHGTKRESRHVGYQIETKKVGSYKHPSGAIIEKIIKIAKPVEEVVHHPVDYETDTTHHLDLVTGESHVHQNGRRANDYA